MADNGYTRSYRRKWEHAAFRNMAEAAVWAWMCDAAVWRDTTLSTQFGPVHLKRSQLLIAQNSIVEKFKMGRTTVRRLLSVLEKEKMVSLQTNHPAANAGTIVTILNYDKYQPLVEEIEGEQPASDQPPTTHQPSSDQQEKESNKWKEGNNSGGASAPPSKYAFEGEVIRLSKADYERWQKMCPTLVKLNQFDGILWSRDDWLQTRKEEERKRWFNSTPNHLRNKDQEAAIKLRTVGKPEGADTNWAGDYSPSNEEVNSWYSEEVDEDELAHWRGKTSH